MDKPFPHTKYIIVTIELIGIVMLTVMLLINVIPSMASGEPNVDIPLLISYQGYLTDSSGHPIDGTVDLYFAIYDSPSTTTTIWKEKQLATTVTDGLFTVTLGSNAPLDPVFFDGNRYLGIAVESDSEMTPRQQITTIPYAFIAHYANDASTLDGKDSNEFADTHSLDASDGSPVNALFVDSSGEVGIGTTSPGEKLTVAGVIESTSGGIKFPDGTTQLTTAGNDTRHTILTLANLMDLFHFGIDFPADAIDAVDCSQDPASASFAFVTGSGTLGQVIGFMGEDGISQRYTYSVAIKVKGAGLNMGDYVGKAGEVVYQRGATSSVFQGLITQMGLASYDGSDSVYVLRLQPVISTLDWSSDCRIYQDLDTPDVVSAVLQPTIIDYSGSGHYDDRCIETHHPLEFEMMYHESPVDFASRLMEREGIHYHFEEGASGELMVIGDDNSAFSSPGATLHYYGHHFNPGTGQEFISSIQRKVSLFTGDTIVSGYDFINPSLSITGSDNNPAGIGEMYEYADNVNTTSVADWRAQVNLERQTMKRNQIFCTSNAASLRSGYLFTIIDDSGAGHGGSYLVTEVRHMAMYDEIEACYTYCNVFTAIPSTTTYRAELNTSIPYVTGVVTAVVTGPTGQTQYTDSYGRIKVQFRWDREGTFDENSSAWIRVDVPSGKLNEQYFVPEIGTEVLISFLQGNPSLPVVIGALFNGDYLPPDPNDCVISISEDGDLTISGPRDIIIDATRNYYQSSGNDMTIEATQNYTESSGNDMTINSGRDIKATISRTIDIDAIVDVDLLAGGSIDIAGSFMDLLATLIQLNVVTSGSYPAARVGDSVIGGEITTGSSSVLIGP